MKLFQRTLWSFVGVIALQALLAGAALGAMLGSMQAEDAAREIASEAANAYESFNAWKLAFWKEINALAEDTRLSRTVGASSGSPAWDEAVTRELSLRLSSSAAAATLVLDGREGLSRYLGPGAEDAGLPDPNSFSMKKEHPYVEIISAKGSLWFVGAVRLAPRSSRRLDLFLLKKIDAELVSHLSYDPMVAVAVSGPGGGAAGRYSGYAATGKAGRDALAFARDLLGPGKLPIESAAYVTYPRRDWMGGSYSAVVHRTGTVAMTEGEKPVLLAAVLSLADYGARVVRLQRSVLVVSLIVVAITIIVALVLSRSIVSPIRLLSRATRRIADGDYRAEVRGQESGEIGELLDGFNGMAKKLAADKLELEEYISEIVGLKERGDGIIESIREGLAVIDSEGVLESANGSFRALFGDSPAGPGSRIVDIERGPFDEAIVETARAALHDRESRGGITRRAADGRSFEIKLYPLVALTRPEDARCIVIVEDASERLAYEEKVIQADRLASIGMLSAGVAHEINNPLSSILANVGNAISEAEDPELVASLRVVESETLRIARIVRQLLDFSAPRRYGEYSAASPPRCDANAVVKELVLLVAYPFRGVGRVEFKELLDPDCPEAAIGEDELKQVLLNLLKNALQAVGAEGLIRVETRAVDEGVEISVADNGPGIPEEAMGRIFDPFFTTKQAPAVEGGAGMGLGLSVAYGIVTKRGGSIRAAAEPGGGALFLVLLPAAARAEPAAAGKVDSKQGGR
jgi:signal transduction histidine kinase